MKAEKGLIPIIPIFLTIILCCGLTLPAYATGHSAGEGSAAMLAMQATNNLPPVWLLAPFATLLLMIATGPLLFHRFWERNYPVVSTGLGVLVAGYYGFLMENGLSVLEHTLEEYISFIALISSLFVVSGGILIRIERRGTPFVNSLLLLLGAVIANLIGTTGASMLLIRPY
ncbi:MAG: citrate transporter, partial [Chlorobiaceae bacterium]|nr:citrate transporter [Chlorobiaceae bacterium]